MKKIFKYSLMFATVVALSMSFVACENDDEEALNNDEETLKMINENYVENVVKSIYGSLKESSKELMEALEDIKNDEDVEAACNAWKEARADWEWSEAFLFGPASDFAIDPHIDTWPFNTTMFDAFMEKYDPINKEEDANILRESIATAQQLTGFHAVEYLIFRDSLPRPFNNMTEKEIWFAGAAAEDLYLSAIKLVAAWGGDITGNEEAMLEDVEFESRNYGEDFINAGQPGSSYPDVLLATTQIIAGCRDIIDEVANEKIGNPYTGEDVNYIESPHAYNSIQDFYDNIEGCLFAINGGFRAESPKEKSLIAYCLDNNELKAYAEDVQEKFEIALEAIKGMKKPFVKYYNDPTAGTAIDKLNELDDSLSKLEKAMLDL